MKIVVTGSKTITDPAIVRAAIAAGIQHYKIKKVTELATGDESPVDAIAKEWATENGIPIKEFPAKFDNTEERTKRSIAMGKYVNYVFFVYDGVSLGVKNAIEQCKFHTIVMFIYTVNPDGTNIKINQLPT